MLNSTTSRKPVSIWNAALLSPPQSSCEVILSCVELGSDLALQPTLASTALRPSPVRLPPYLSLTSTASRLREWWKLVSSGICQWKEETPRCCHPPAGRSVSPHCSVEAIPSHRILRYPEVPGAACHGYGLLRAEAWAALRRSAALWGGVGGGHVLVSQTPALGLLHHTWPFPVGGSAQHLAGGATTRVLTRQALSCHCLPWWPPWYPVARKQSFVTYCFSSDVTQLVNDAVIGSVCLMKPQRKCGLQPHSGFRI